MGFLLAASLQGQEVAAIAIGLGSLVTIVIVVISLSLRHESKKRQLRHAERMKAFETGQPMPEGEVARATALGFIGVLVPLAAIGIGIGATAMLWHEDASALEYNYGLLKIIWLVCGGLAAATAVTCINALRRVGPFGEELDKVRSQRAAAHDKPI